MVDPILQFLASEKMPCVRNLAVAITGREADRTHDSVAVGFGMVRRAVAQEISAKEVESLVETGELLHGIGDCSQPATHTPLVREEARKAASAYGGHERELKPNHGSHASTDWIGNLEPAFRLPGERVPDLQPVDRAARELMENLDRLEATLTVPDDHGPQPVFLVVPGDHPGHLRAALITTEGVSAIGSVGDADFGIAHADEKFGE